MGLRRRISFRHRAAAALGRGLLAGVAGTAVMTVSSTIEAKATGRGASTTPAQALGKVAGVRPRDESGEQRFNTIAHWGYGTAWGLGRAAIDLAGLRGPWATVGHLTAVLLAEQALMPALGVGSPTPSYGMKAMVTDAFHHGVYAAATGAAYDYLYGH